jgi:hypothetical protein
VGRGVWIYWCGTPSGLSAAHFGTWQEARIAAYDAATGEHVVRPRLVPRCSCTRREGGSRTC